MLVAFQRLPRGTPATRLTGWCIRIASGARQRSTVPARDESKANDDVNQSGSFASCFA